MKIKIEPRSFVSNLEEHPYFLIGLTPVSEGSPCGENVRYEQDFEQLEAELGKQESLSAETVDWEVVAKLSAKIIQNSSKDLLVGSYFCYALLVKENYVGLAIGIKVLNDMISEHWDCLFPPAKRLRARATAFTWLVEKAALKVAEKIPTPAESEAAIFAFNSLRELDNNLVEKMGDQAPMLNELSRPLKSYKQSAEAELVGQVAATPEPEAVVAAESVPAASEAPSQPEPVVAAPVPAAPVAEKAKAPTAAAVETGNLESEADTKKALRQLQTGIRDIASFQVSQKLSDPRPYRLARVSAWIVVENVPPDNSGLTQINPPAAERIKFFESLIDKSDHRTLVPELEKTLSRSPFWLDGHFLVVKSLRQLGAEYEAAVQTVIRELNNFLSRLPEVIDLSFSDESAFANDQTRLWIESEVQAQASDTGDGGQQAAGDAWSIALTEARQLVAGGDAQKAQTLMRQGFAAAAQLRDQMYWRCAVAELSMLTGLVENASTILERLSEQLKSRQIGEWEPQLLVLVYTLLFQSYQKQQKSKKDDKVIKDKMDLAYTQLCWFDPVNTLSLKGG
ncbi:MAG: type VI secretion system protein VasJ [Gammaproteobacteria bacterium]